MRDAAYYDGLDGALEHPDDAKPRSLDAQKARQRAIEEGRLTAPPRDEIDCRYGFDSTGRFLKIDDRSSGLTTIDGAFAVCGDDGDGLPSRSCEGCEPEGTWNDAPLVPVDADDPASPLTADVSGALLWLANMPPNFPNPSATGMNITSTELSVQALSGECGGPDCEQVNPCVFSVILTLTATVEATPVWLPQMTVVDPQTQATNVFLNPVGAVWHPPLRSVDDDTGETIEAPGYTSCFYVLQWKVTVPCGTSVDYDLSPDKLKLAIGLGYGSPAGAAAGAHLALSCTGCGSTGG